MSHKERDDRDNADNPGVVAPPPLIYAGALAAGLTINRLRPVPFLPHTLGRALGPLLIAGGVLIGVTGFRAMRRAGTNVDPREPATTVVQTGPYRYTRNPLYASMALIYSGVTAFANALPAVLLLPIVLHVMRYGVIEREEHYLEGKFGEEYLKYKARVRRWV